jgi:hypothetical protein
VLDLDLDMLVNREVDWTLFHEDNQVFASPLYDTVCFLE